MKKIYKFCCIYIYIIAFSSSCYLSVDICVNANIPFIAISNKSTPMIIGVVGGVIALALLSAGVVFKRKRSMSSAAPPDSEVRSFRAYVLRVPGCGRPSVTCMNFDSR